MTSDLTARAAYRVAKARHHLRKRRSIGPEPVVVFSMAKTGSSAVVNGLRSAGFENVHHVHDLDPTFLAAEETEYGWGDRPWRNWDAQALLRRPPTAAAPWRVVSIARDPIAQSVSAFFQPGARRGYLHAGATVEELLDRFGDRLDRLPLHWFETHLLPALGIDVYASPFDHDAGRQVVSTPPVELLLLRNEDLASAGSAALAHFVGADQPIPIPPVNVAAGKAHADLYADFLAALRPSADAVDAAYSSRYVRHFYTEPEIGDLRRRWTADPRDERHR
jgi:hypothetical protein